MLVGISILVACATLFAYLQLPGATSHDQVDTSTPSPASAGAAAASQRPSSFPSLVWAFLCAGLGLSGSGRSRGSGGGGPGFSRVLGARTAPVVSPASIQLPLLQQGSSFPLSTNSTSLSAASVPAISDVPQMRVSSPEESPDTTPKARPTKLVNAIVPSISLSVDEEDDDTPPAFPAINSAQRARTTSSNFNQDLVSSNRFNGNTSSGFSMAPPPLPQIRGRNPRSQLSVIAPSAPRPSPAALVRGTASQRATVLPGTAGGTAQAANGGVSSLGSGGLVVPPTHNAPPTKPNRKVILEPGHSPLDWARLCRTAPSELLRGLDVAPGLLRVTPSMLEKYGRPRKPRSKEKGGGLTTGDVEKQEMVWMALEGKVYNITAYIPFHPGGEGELLRAAGKDGTSLFMKTHSWVNVEGMLGGCLIGILVSEEEEAGVKVGPGLEDVD